MGTARKLLIQDLTTKTPALAQLGDDQRKNAAHQGWLASFHLADPTLRDPAASANAALDPTT